MSNLKINSNLFLGSAELNRLQYMLQDVGYQRNILENTVSFGLVKSNQDISFQNGLIQPDIDVISSGTTFKTIKLNPLSAIDKNGNFVSKSLTNGIKIPGDSNWYWVRVSYQTSNIESGTFSLTLDGTLSGVNGQLTKLLRGFPNIASTIRFPNAVNNTLDYQILEVIDDNNATLNGVTFQAETGLDLAVVGSFTYGVSVPTDNKLIFNYDDCFFELVPETGGNNIQPTAGYTSGKTFYLARLKSDGTTLVLQDKRSEYWETKGSQLAIDIETKANPLIGIESIRFDHSYSTQVNNLVQLSWGFRSSNWAVNSATNTLTLSSGLGGKYKSITDFTNGDFDGWRLYYQNGSYSRIVTSVKQGNAINLVLDHLEVNDLSVDGGNTFETTQTVIAVPDTEEVEIFFQSATGSSTDISLVDRSFVFPVKELFGICNVLVYDPTESTYNIFYRYKTLKNYTEYVTIPADSTHGYYNETSFDANGNLNPSPSAVTQVEYPVNQPSGAINLILSPTAYSRFTAKVDKGDLIGTTNLNGSLPNQVLLKVGVNENYLYINGAISLTDNVNIILDTDNAVDGNEFRIHFQCSSFAFNGFVVQLSSGNGSGTSILRNITSADMYQMQNIDGGIVFDCKYRAVSWIYYQNFELGQPNQVVDLWNVVPSNLFDSSGAGKVKGLFGYGLATGATVNGVVTPNLQGMFVTGLSQTDSDYSTVGQTGGVKKNTITEDNLFELDLPTGYDGPHQKPEDGGGAEEYYVSGHGVTGSGTPTPLENRPPYFTLIKAYKLF